MVLKMVCLLYYIIIAIALNISYQINPYLKFQNNTFEKKPSFGYKNLSNNEILYLKNIFFHYPNNKENILKNISLDIKLNSTTAIIGENGAGKSTLIKLLCGFYNEYNGNIYWNNNIKKPKIFGMFQDFSKLPLSLIDNLALSNEKQLITLKEELNELDLTFLMKDINKILSPEISGIDLSIGQWQKLSLARVIAHSNEADLLIFDEPNSALDPDSERKIIEKILKLSKGKSSIIISHRMSVCRFVDNIAVMDKGEIIEYGSHNVLMNKKGKYFEMFTTQAKSYYNI